MNTEKIIVVYTQKREKYTHLLAQLISANFENEVNEWEE